MTNKKLTFSVGNIEEVLDRNIDKSQFALLRVDAFSTEPSLHETYVTEETLRKTSESILLKPFVFFVDTRFDDVGTHDTREVPGGFVPHDSSLDFSTNANGNLWFHCDVLIWKKYSNKLLEYFNRDGGKKGISVEIEVYQERNDIQRGLTEIIDFAYTAITCIGDLIRPAINNAQAVLVFAKEFEEAKKEYEFASRYDDLDFVIPKNVRNNAKKALESKKGSSVALALARYLTGSEKANPDRIKQIYKYLKNKNLSEMDEVVLGLYGGKQGFKWSKDLFEKMAELDEKQATYFSSDEKESEKPSDEIEKKEDSEDMTKKKDEFAEGEEPKEEKMAEEEKQEEKPEEEMAAPEEPEKEDEKEESDEKKFSLDAYVDVGAALAFLKEETEDNDEMAQKVRLGVTELEKGEDADFGLVMQGMYAKMVKMSAKMAKMDEDSKVYLAENEDMKNRFAEIEKNQKQFAVESFLRELTEDIIIPDEKISEFRNESEKFSFAEIDSWKNSCKAMSFDFKLKKQKDDVDDDITIFALPFDSGSGVTVADSPWEVTNK